MKPAVDEMFPEGAGPYVDLDEVNHFGSYKSIKLTEETVRTVFTITRLTTITNVSLASSYSVVQVKIS